MKFLLLLYGDEAAEAALPVTEQRRIIDEHDAFGDALRDSGAFVFGSAVDESAAARTVRDGVVTDGPFTKTREQIGGVYVISGANIDEAVAYAKQVPRSPDLTVEVRPLLEI
jgi:hypothetical protein